MKALIIYTLLLALAGYAVSALLGGKETNRRPRRRDEIEAAIDEALSLNNSMRQAPCMVVV